jgi:hypothetical protein
MVWAAHGASHPVGLATWRVVHSIDTSCRVIASGIHAPMQSAMRRYTVARLYTRMSARFAGYDDAMCPHVLYAPR